MKPCVKTGLEMLLESPPDDLKDKRLGLLCNPASVDSHLCHASRLIHHRFPGQLKALYSPQHGFYAEKQDNMIESDHFVEPELGIPVYSLYNDTRIPTPKMFDPIDILLVDIQDVGTRVYTFIYTISYCLETAARLDKKVIILDRPNPVNGTAVEGNLLEEDCTSFVGRFPIPMRHGLTVGEISNLFNREHSLGCELDIIPMTGWKRRMYWEDTGLFWVPPSPNLPAPASCIVYPGQVILEGTNISEGRGTCLPFEQFGAPFIDPGPILREIQKRIHGALLRPVNFEPTSGKWQGKVCRGFQIHVTDRNRFKPYFSSLLILQTIIRHHAASFEFKAPPYEYEYEKLPMALILGSESLCHELEALTDPAALEMKWEPELARFITLSQRYRIYD